MEDGIIEPVMLEDERAEERGAEFADEVELTVEGALELLVINKDVASVDKEMEEDIVDTLDWEVLLAREDDEDLEGDGDCCCLHVPKPIWQPSPQ